MESSGALSAAIRPDRRLIDRAARSLALALTLAVWPGCAQRNEPAPVRFEAETWSFGQVPGTRLTTDHYEIYTTLQDDVLLEALPGFVEAAFAHYQQLVPSDRTAPRMKIFLLGSRGQWEHLTARFTRPHQETYLQIRNGGYVHRGVAVIEYVAHQVTFPLFAHEGWHQYLHHYVQPRVPAWLNEGLAVSCEGQRWGFSGIKEFDPWYNPLRRNQLIDALQRDKLHGLKKLLATHPGEVIHETTRAVSTYYAQVWTLVLFLQEGADGRYAEGFQRMVRELGRIDAGQHARAAAIWSDGEPVSRGEALFRNYISEDLGTVEEEYRAFLAQRLFGT